MTLPPDQLEAIILELANAINPAFGIKTDRGEIEKLLQEFAKEIIRKSIEPC